MSIMLWQRLAGGPTGSPDWIIGAGKSREKPGNSRFASVGLSQLPGFGEDNGLLAEDVFRECLVRQPLM